ncbi:MAG: GNAT family N-acetyltransferase [Bacteroidales bacterium]|nr:GNAT family N-acetyltransferase [Bacteroidales bacterium]
MTDNMLQFERTSNVEVLSSFFCGERAIDQLIHKRENGLSSFVSEVECDSFIVSVMDEPVAVFVYSEASIALDGKAYPSIEIDFIAVRRDYRLQGIGTKVVQTIESYARSKHYPFLTVDAYHNKRYSAEGFYLKCGFERNEVKGEHGKVVPMFKQLLLESDK